MVVGGIIRLDCRISKYIYPCLKGLHVQPRFWVYWIFYAVCVDCTHAKKLIGGILLLYTCANHGRMHTQTRPKMKCICKKECNSALMDGAWTISCTVPCCCLPRYVWPCGHSRQARTVSAYPRRVWTAQAMVKCSSSCRCSLCCCHSHRPAAWAGPSMRPGTYVSQMVRSCLKSTYH